MTRKPYQPGRVFVGRLPKGADLMAAIGRIANEEGIKTGTVTAAGWLSKAVFVRLEAGTGMQRTDEHEGMLEIAALSGTISQFKGRSLPRLNGVILAGAGGPPGEGSAPGTATTFAGTIGLGTTVFACEVVLTELVGGTLSRDFDAETGLPLWKESSLLLSV